MGFTLLVLAIYVLVAARVTRLVNYDTVLDPLRLWLARKVSAGNRKWLLLVEFMACPWCVGMWASVALAPLAIHVLAWPWWTWAVLPWAASHLVGIGDRWVSDPLEIVEDA